MYPIAPFVEWKRISLITSSDEIFKNIFMVDYIHRGNSSAMLMTESEQGTRT
jgi:hypothetical protein